MLELDGLEVIHDVIYLIEDLTKGVITFETDTEVKGQLGLFFVEIPLKARVSCEVYVNMNDQTIIHQDCYAEVLPTFSTLFLARVSLSGAPDLPRLQIRVPYPFQWGAATFDAGEAFTIMVASFVALVESIGAFYAVSRYASATPLPPSILSHGIGWQGFSRSESAHLLALTCVGSRKVVQISAGFMIFFSILEKFGAVFASIPALIVAGLYCLFFAYVGLAGLSFLQFCNLNSFRTKFILGFSFFMGLSIPQYFNEYTAVNSYGPVHTGARWFNDMINVPFSSKPFFTSFLAFFLDATLHKKDNATRKDRGMHWWDRFRSNKTDTRSEEFYSLPFNLNKFFPSV